MDENSIENKENEINEKEHIREVYTDKAKNLTKISLVLLGFDVITYIYAIFVYQSFDFGMIFELISFTFAIICFDNIDRENYKKAKRYNIISEFSSGWLVIYDLIIFILNFIGLIKINQTQYIQFNTYEYYLYPILSDIIIIIAMVLLYRAYKSIQKAIGEEKEENYTDSFYDNM